MKHILFIFFIVGLLSNALYAQEKEIYLWDDQRLYDGTLFGKEITVEFIVVDSATKGGVCYLNSHPNWKKYFAAAISREDFVKFPSNPEKYYLKKKIRVSGLLLKYFENKPGIVLKSPAQIKVIETTSDFKQ